MIKVALCAGGCAIAGLVASSAGPAAPSSAPWFRVTEHRLASDGSTTNQPMRVVEVRRDGRRRVVARASTWVAVSPDGRYRAWVVERDGRSSIMVGPVAGGNARAVGEAACLVSSGAQCLGTSWSPTNLLAFVTFDGGDEPTYTVGVARANGALLRRFAYPVRTGPDRTVTRSVGSWSPDGRRVLLESREQSGGFDSGSTFSLLDVQTWRMRPIFRWRGRKDRPAPAWSPDGRRLALVSESFGATPAYVLVDAVTGRTVVRRPRCTDRPACPWAWPAWSHDGKEVVYWSRPDPSLARARPDLSQARYVSTTSSPYVYAWEREGLLARPLSGPPRVVLLSADTGALLKTIYRGPAGWLMAGVEVP